MASRDTTAQAKARRDSIWVPSFSAVCTRT